MVALLFAVALWPVAEAQDTNSNTVSPSKSDIFSKTSFCGDYLTRCFFGKDGKLVGLRLLADVSIGFENLEQRGPDYVETSSLSALPFAGIEIAPLGNTSIATFQYKFVLFGKDVEFTEESEVVVERRLTDSESRSVDVEWGHAVSVTFLEGSLQAGIGGVFFDKQDFVSRDGRLVDPTDAREEFYFVSFQPLSMARKLLQLLDP